MWGLSYGSLNRPVSENSFTHNAAMPLSQLISILVGLIQPELSNEKIGKKPRLSGVVHQQYADREILTISNPAHVKIKHRVSDYLAL